MPPRQLRLNTLRLSALPFFRSLLELMAAEAVRLVEQLVHDAALEPGGRMALSGS